MSKVYRQFRDRVATVRLSRSAHRDIKFDALVDALDIDKTDVPKLLGLIDAKIDRLNKLDNRFHLIAGAATLLLFASLYGVDFEIEFLGIKLSGLSKLKELIFCGLSLAGLITVASRGSITHLRGIRKRLFIRQFGKAAYEIHAPVFNDDFSYDFDVPLGTDRYYPTRPTMILEALRVFLELVPLFIFGAAAIFVGVFIAFDIWDRSNLPEPWGKVLIGVSYVGWALQIVVSTFSHIWPFRFIDVAKEKEIQVRDPETGALHPVLRTLINRNVVSQLMSRTIVEGVFFIMVISALFFSTTHSQRILEFVRAAFDGGGGVVG